MNMRQNVVRLGVLFCGVWLLSSPGAIADDRPNILWITSEDHSPTMGCYGDTFATTPHVDRLAARGTVYLHAWATAPVCAPSRSTLIAGLYANSTGSEHMRSMVPYPVGKKMFPQYLHEAGYYCVNNVKEDYSLTKPGPVWDESSARAHWNKRAPGQPFFAVFNSTKSHESRLRIRPHQAVHDPAKVRVPAYHPDAPEVRQDWAQYYDTVSAADVDAGIRLEELEKAGLIDDTIVFYFSDHGAGMPRSKNWPYNSGLQIAFIVYIPERFQALRSPDYRPGGRSERLVSLVDCAPTVLSLAGIEPPVWMQGHALFGKYQQPPQPFLFGHRGRTGEREDLMRTATDGRYVYIRNYMPHLIYGRYIEVSWTTPTMALWERMYRAGKLNAAQSAFWNRKPPEELYDLRNDPDETNNLATSPTHAAIKTRLHRALEDHMRAVRDVGFIPEGERLERSSADSPYDLGHDPMRYPFDRVLSIAEMASMLEPQALPALRDATKDVDSTVRYWALLGIAMRGAAAVNEASADLRRALTDRSPYVRIVAAEALARFGVKKDINLALRLLIAHADWQKNGVFVALSALVAIDALEGQAAPLAREIHALPSDGPVPDERFREYPRRVLKTLRTRLPLSLRAPVPEQ